MQTEPQTEPKTLEEMGLTFLDQDVVQYLITHGRHSTLEIAREITGMDITATASLLHALADRLPALVREVLPAKAPTMLPHFPGDDSADARRLWEYAFEVPIGDFFRYTQGKGLEDGRHS
jgi:hypothetical protein